MKNLINLGFVFGLIVSLNACGQNNSPNSSYNKETVNFELNNDQDKKIDDKKWLSFKESFNKRSSIEDKVIEMRINKQTESIKKEFNLNKKKKISLSDIIDPKKWEEFQIAFRSRSEYYYNQLIASLR
jgi:hypothetical protein